MISYRSFIRLLGACLMLLSLAPASPVSATEEEKFITLASTTSTQASGLFDWLLPKFKAASGIEVRVVAVGTGAAIRLAREGDADALLVHHKASEVAFVADGFGLERHEVMYNDFVIVGPKADPAGIGAVSDAAAALQKIADHAALFISRGDDSGTHAREQQLWQKSGRNPQTASGGWYREIGAGMGAALNMAAGMDAYTLTDRGTWISFQNRQALALLFEGDTALRNVYSVIQVNPDRHPHVKAKAAEKFVNWVISDAGQQAIAEFRIRDKILFKPLAKKPKNS